MKVWPGSLLCHGIKKYKKKRLYDMLRALDSC